MNPTQSAQIHQTILKEATRLCADHARKTTAYADFAPKRGTAKPRKAVGEHTLIFPGYIKFSVRGLFSSEQNKFKESVLDAVARGLSKKAGATLKKSTRISTVYTFDIEGYRVVLYGLDHEPDTIRLNLVEL